MMTIICITILVYWIMGKDIRLLMEKIRDVNWHEKSGELIEKIRPYALKIGRIATKPILQFYYVMENENTSALDRALIYGAIIYTISPVSLIPSSVYKILGVLDEGAVILYVYKKIKAKITPEINYKVEHILDEWFGTEYEVIP